MTNADLALLARRRPFLVPTCTDFAAMSVTLVIKAVARSNRRSVSAAPPGSVSTLGSSLQRAAYQFGRFLLFSLCSALSIALCASSVRFGASVRRVGRRGAADSESLRDSSLSSLSLPVAPPELRADSGVLPPSSPALWASSSAASILIGASDLSSSTSGMFVPSLSPTSFVGAHTHRRVPSDGSNTRGLSEVSPSASCPLYTMNSSMDSSMPCSSRSIFHSFRKVGESEFSLPGMYILAAHPSSSFRSA